MFSNEQLIAIRDPLWHHIYLPKELYAITKTDAFARLSRIKQLGPTYLVYPGATHTRYAHSLGVYHLAVTLLPNLLLKGADTWITKTGQKSYAAAALLHDIGHFPFTHSLKELPLKEHEQLTAEIILTKPIATLLTQWGANPEQTAAIIDETIQINDSETLFFRKLLSGVLDPDKLDYLNRDAYFCGVPYGIQDIDYINAHLIPDKEKGISVNSSSIATIENLLFSKYLMYRSVYWHPKVRIATAMMKKTLYAAITKQILNPEELYHLDDETLYLLLNKKLKAVKSTHFPEYHCAKHLREHTIFLPLIEIPFDLNNTTHCNLENLKIRTNQEHNIADILQISPEKILIDIPEKISFETNLFIQDEKVSFSKSSTVFTKNTIFAFVSNLRKIRVAIHPKHINQSKFQIQKIKEILLNYGE